MIGTAILLAAGWWFAGMLLLAAIALANGLGWRIILPGTTDLIIMAGLMAAVGETIRRRRRNRHNPEPSEVHGLRRFLIIVAIAIGVWLCLDAVSTIGNGWHISDFLAAKRWIIYGWAAISVVALAWWWDVHMQQPRPPRQKVSRAKRVWARAMRLLP